MWSELCDWLVLNVLVLNVCVEQDQTSEGLLRGWTQIKAARRSESTSESRAGVIHNKTGTSNLGFTEPHHDQRKQAFTPVSFSTLTLLICTANLPFGPNPTEL